MIPGDSYQHKIGISCTCMWFVYSKVIMDILSYQDGRCHRGLTGSCECGGEGV